STCSSTSVPAPVAEKRREWVSHPRRRRRAYTSRTGRSETTSSSGCGQGRPRVRATSNATVSGASTKVVNRSWDTGSPSQTGQDEPAGPGRMNLQDPAEGAPAGPGRRSTVRITARVDYAVRAALELAAAA